MSYSSLLNQRCSIERKTTTLNSSAQMKQVWRVIYTEIPCRLDKIGNFTSTLSQTPTGQTSRNEFVCFMMRNQDILSGDRIKVDGDYLYVTPYLKVYDSKKLHHREVFVSTQET